MMTGTSTCRHLGISRYSLKKLVEEGHLTKYQWGYDEVEIQKILDTYTNHTCRVCGHNWTRKKPGIPIRCPRCNNKLIRGA